MTELPEPTGRRTRRKPLKASGSGGQVHRKLLGEARLMTANRRSAPRLNAEALEALQEGLDGLVADLRFQQKMVDGLSEDELWRDTMMSGKIPNEWIRLRNETRDRINVIALQIARTGIADRAVKVQEAQLALLFQRIREAFERAGLDGETIHRVGIELQAIAKEEQGG